MLCCQRRFASEIKVVITAGEDALHRVGGGVARCGHPGLVAVAAQVVVVAHQTLEAPAPKVSLHTRVAGNPLMSGHGVCKQLHMLFDRKPQLGLQGRDAMTRLP